MDGDMVAPPDGEEPTSASLTVHRPSDEYWTSGTVQSHEVSEAEDGWIPVHITAAFNFAGSW